MHNGRIVLPFTDEWRLKTVDAFIGDAIKAVLTNPDDTRVTPTSPEVT
jgi:hypothetical protein